MKATLALALLTSAVALPAAQPTKAQLDNWAQWRGPLGNGVAPNATPPAEFGESQNLKWKVAIPGEGISTPVVWGNRVFLTTAVNTGRKPEAKAGGPAPAAKVETPAPKAGAQPSPQGGRKGKGGFGGGFGGGAAPTELYQFTVLCLDRATGRTLWQTTAREEVPHEPRHGTSAFAAASPVTDGERLYAFFGSRGLHCYDLDGNLKWKQEFGTMRFQPQWGEGASPALHGDALLVNWDHAGSDFVAALDKRTGSQLWRTERNEPTSWTTPFVVEHQGKPQVVVSGSGIIRSYDLANGKELWECGGMGANTIPTPVTLDGVLYCMTGYTTTALRAIRLGHSGNLTEKADAIVWTLSRNTPYVASPLLYGDRLYFFSRLSGAFSCYDARSGRPHFDAERLQGMGNIYASPLGAAGRVYTADLGGNVLVLKDGPVVDVVHATKLDGAIAASPVAVGKELLLRTKGSLYNFAAK
ncbi:MAG: hypothetical protein FJ386_07805 [Verrucomicrobia bacterium]|nr:hypothetical protein [Verrucomicrobiota bacterium]